MTRIACPPRRVVALVAAFLLLPGLVAAGTEVSVRPFEPVAASRSAVWVADAEGPWWQGSPPVCELTEPGTERSATAWVGVGPEAVRLHVEVTDDRHAGPEGGTSIWKNDCIRVGLDAWGDGVAAEELDADDAFYGIGDAAFCASLTDEGNAVLWMEVTSAVGGRGVREDIPVQIVRDEQAKRTVYDVAIPWAELGLAGPVFPSLGLAIYSLDHDTAPEQGRLRWDATAAKNWSDRVICGVYRPGRFRRVGVPFERSDSPSVAVVHRMLSDEQPGIVFRAMSPGQSGKGADTVRFRLGADSGDWVSQPVGKGTVVAEFVITPPEKIRESMPFRVELLREGQVVATDTATVRPNYRSDWYAFEATSDPAGGSISLASWLDKPAGKHGWLGREGEDFRFADGTGYRIWGLNIGSGTMFGGMSRNDEGHAEHKARLSRYVKFYAKYGVNCLRIHKHMENTGGIWTRESIVELDPEKMDVFDHFTSELKANGIYHAMSGVFHNRPTAADRQYFKHPEDIFKPRVGRDGKVQKDRDGNIRYRSDTYCLSSFAPDVQDFHIKQVVTVLEHKNPYTGLRYADDPAMAFIELRNEDSIFFYATQGRVLACPNYKRMFCEQFSDWLKRKYGTQKALEAAWTPRALNAWSFCYEDESLENRNIFPICNAWWYSPEGLADQTRQFGPGMKRRLLDTAKFLFETQDAFYRRFVKAIRDTGYGGAIVGSCWWAGSGVSHFYNLYSDYRVGFIDRHEYYGGGGVGGRRGFENHSPLAQPGTGSLQEGFTQVADRPFGLSEWIGVNPYPWSADGVPMISVYGLGLQGWDSSFHFASGQGAFYDALGRRWNAMQPVEIGQYPTFARMVHRRDVTEADVVSARNVHMETLANEGRLGFVEEITQRQTADFNAVRGDIPLSALAAGRVVVRFTEEFEKTQPFDIERYMRDGRIVSTTDQLAWTPVESMLDRPGHRQWYDPQGFFTVNTPGTRAVVGFAPRAPRKLGSVTITPDNLFAVIALSAHEREATIDSARRIIVSAVARSLNTGAKYHPSRSMALIRRGQAPITLEPVRATIRLARPGKPTVYLLDHDGRRTDKTLDVREGTFRIDTARDRTMYYEIVYE